MEDAIDYALRYGGRCRDCADTKIDGVCDINGTPCNPRVFRAAIEHALRAWRYGIEHGFIVSPFAHAKDGCAAKDARIAELEAENTDLKDQLGDPEGVVAHSDAIIAMSEKVELENEALKRENKILAQFKDAFDVLQARIVGPTGASGIDTLDKFLTLFDAKYLAEAVMTEEEFEAALADAALQGGQGNG